MNKYSENDPLSPQSWRPLSSSVNELGTLIVVPGSQNVAGTSVVFAAAVIARLGDLAAVVGECLRVDLSRLHR